MQKKEQVSVTIYTNNGTRLKAADIEKFNAQYPSPDVKYTDAFHDRFMVLDGTLAYHTGASLKDAGKKCFGVNVLQDESMVEHILQRLEQ